MRSNISRRAFHALNRNLIIVHMVVAELVQPLAAWYSHRPLQDAVIPMIVSTILIGIVCFARPLGLRRIRQFLMMAALGYTSIALYQMNGGIFGSSLEPALLSFGTASLIAADGNMVSLAIGLGCGWGLTLAGELLFPLFYFGHAFSDDWTRAAAHMACTAS
jgi:hypothetical protein